MPDIKAARGALEEIYNNSARGDVVVEASYYVLDEFITSIEKLIAQQDVKVCALLKPKTKELDG